MDNKFYKSDWGTSHTPIGNTIVMAFWVLILYPIIILLAITYWLWEKLHGEKA